MMASMTSPYSPLRAADDLVTFSGLLGREDGEPAATLEGQLELIFSQLDRALAAAGLARRDVFKTTVWLADLTDWAAMNGPYLDYFRDVELPARSAVGAQLQPGCLVELEAWAYRST